MWTRVSVIVVSFGLLVATLAGMTADGSTPAVAAPAGLACADSASTPIPQPTQAQLDAAGLGDLPLAPDSARRDLVAAPFSDSTSVTNPLFPIAELDSAILNGRVDGKVFHTETTLLPFTQILEWTPGQCVRVLVSQYMAFLDGRLQETAIDLYAQSDDGSVWYLGESVFDYSPKGLVTTTEGTWHAGIEGPAAMIMPSDPQVGDVNRPENIPGAVFEEVEVTKVDQTVDGPSGPISGVMVGTETHQDGSLSDKVFAPGYGEFLSTDGPDVEAMALASPTDSLEGGVPPELSAIAGGADRLFASKLTTGAQWRRAGRVAAGMLEAWTSFRTGDVPPRLVKPMNVALRRLETRIVARDRSGTRAASIDAGYAVNDLQLRYRAVAEVDTMRFELWARRALVDAADGSIGGVRSDVVTLEWIRDRIAHTLDAVTLTRLDTVVGDLGTAVVDRDLDGAAAAASELAGIVTEP
ncbi:MAG: hypothetical protein OEV60_09980 [Actinomycetota bacterium]|nr:hypothetical protein [Actinomycetota bacterium]MDH5223806.1 hypothetical protein [Actinomycetota bacterium]